MRRSVLRCTCLASPSLRRPLSTSRNYGPGDAALRAAFDEPATSWRSTAQSWTTKGGLFGHATLQRPSDLGPLVERTARRAQLIVARIEAEPGHSESLDNATALRRMSKLFDRLSDVLCGVIDMCEAVRNVHPSSAWVEAADQAYNDLSEAMNVLNTHVGLHGALKTVFDRVGQQCPSELFAAHTVAAQFIYDFEKSGIHLPPAEREQFVSLSQSILTLGRRFLQPDSSDVVQVELSADELLALGSNLSSRLRLRKSKTRGGAVIAVAPNSFEEQVLTRYHPHEAVRQRVYRQTHSPSSPLVSTLEDMLRTRARLAKLVGKGSWAEVALVDKMAKTPEDVSTFLDALSASNQPLALKEADQLSAAKRGHLGQQSSDDRIQMWDRDFYGDRALAMASATPTSALSSYFSAGTVIQGMSRLFTHLYGVRFELEEVDSSEQLWHPSVRKLAVIDERAGRLGTMYCDLSARRNKPPGAAHYTVRCSRRVDDDDAELDHADEQSTTLAVEGARLGQRPGLYQLPVVALTCDFTPPSSREPALLEPVEVETLFHEFGHAMHSMFGHASTYHNLAGTRCATDFVELPSVLMESFAGAEPVLQLFARHYETDTPLPLDVFRQSLRRRKAFDALETNSQITMAALDQAYHTAAPLSDSFDSTQVYREVQDRFSVIPSAPDVAWQSRFGHIVSYGATYYSYLFDRAIAGKVWSTVFAQDPLSREAGERYRTEVLQYGGGKDPWQCIGGLLQDDRVSRGDQTSMRLVGEWGANKSGL